MFFDLSFNQLLTYSVHVGHNVSNTLMYSAWFVSAFRQSTAIINLFKTILMFRITFLLLSNIISYQGPIWFINIDKSVDRYVKFSALSCGEFSVTQKWINGSISNYPNVLNLFRNIKRSSNFILSNKQKRTQSALKHWMLTRHSWPRVIFSSNLKTSYAPIKEATSLKIPSISIVDTDGWSQVVSLPIPGNDESLNCVVFYNDLVCNFILYKKFTLISSWYSNIRVSSRLVAFNEWVLHRYGRSDYNIKNVLTFNYKFTNKFTKNLSLYLSSDFWKDSYQESLDFSNNIDIKPMLSKLFPRFFFIKKKLFSFVTFHFFKKYFIYKGYYKKKFLTEYNFKKRFLVNKFFFFRYYKGHFINYQVKEPFKKDTPVFKNIAMVFFAAKYLKVRLMWPMYASFIYRWAFLAKLLIKPSVLSNTFEDFPFNIDIYNRKKNRKHKIIRSLKKDDFGYSIKNHKWRFYVSNNAFDVLLPLNYWFFNNRSLFKQTILNNPIITENFVSSRNYPYLKKDDYDYSYIYKFKIPQNTIFKGWYWK